ncbi:MAG TPA: HAMP domain-containing sensor histidine kinase [Chitinispirillaceae bacterium]|nr:HAMP domain-containing sensor histidine kinase [Chitinispirillaceae bacterium]
MNSHDTSFAKGASSPGRTKNKTWFLQPPKKVAFDIGGYFLLNTVLIYCLLFLTSDTFIGMIGIVWVGIIALRGGVFAGILGTAAINFSIFVATLLPFHKTIIVTHYLDDKIPSYAMGISQNLIVALVVGYISTLNHKLRDEMKLRERAQRDLEQKVSELETFGHKVAHDLKNPLLMISVSISSLTKQFSFSDNQKAGKKLTLINNGTQQMINIIESLLLLTGVKKIDSGEFGVFSISESVDEALRRMEYKIESNNIQVCKPDTWPSIFGYAPWVTEIWVNYIDNAIKYGTNPDPEARPVIVLGYDKNDKAGHVRFWVKDNGEGIAKEKAGVLFTELGRLHAGRRQGHGIGLTIVKLVVEKFNGFAGVESEPGKGSLFYFTLPVNNPGDI